MLDLNTTIVTREQYDGLNPREQGYVSYMQGARNGQVPERCPYGEGYAHRQWLQGQAEACIDTQEVDS